MSEATFALLSQATLETLYMVGFSGIAAFIFGLPLGIILTLTKTGGFYPRPYLHRGLSLTVDVTRSIPFVILLIAIIPFTRLLVGTSIGSTAAIVPLACAAIPFFARIVESALNEVPKTLIEAGIAMGASPLQIVRMIFLPEAKPGLIAGVTITLINLVGYSAMAGVVGGGGLGDLAIRYGYQRFDVTIIISTVMILVFLVQCLQGLGNRIAQHYSHR